MKSKNLIYLCILFCMVLVIVFLGGYEYVKAQPYETLGLQPWKSLAPYNMLWPSQTLTLPSTNVTTPYAPILEPLTVLPDLRQSMMMQTPMYGDTGWFQEINIRTSMPIYDDMDYGFNMLGPQPEPPDFPDYGSEFLNIFQETQWNPYAYPGRFAPARIRSTLYEFTTQIEEQMQVLFPTPRKDWQPYGSGGGGGWLPMAGGGSWTSYGRLGPVGGSWLGYGNISGITGYSSSGSMGGW